MAKGKTQYFSEQILKHLIGTTYTQPVDWYIGLLSNSPVSVGPFNEITGNSYIRQKVALSFASGELTNVSDIFFPAANPGGWGVINGYALYDAETNGNVCYYGDLTPPRTVVAGTSVYIEASALTINEY